MTTPLVNLDQVSDTPHGKPPLMWKWSVDAVKAALEHAGTPPKLDIQAMLNAAFAVDGPELTGLIFQVAIGDRVKELDQAPILLDVSRVTSVELSGQFLLMLLSGRLDLLQPHYTHLDSPDAPSTEG